MTGCRLALGLALIAALAGCDLPQTGQSAPSGGETPKVRMNLFGNPDHSITVRRANTDIAREFMDLSFALENGQQLARLTRFEGPIKIKFAGIVPPYADHDLNQLIERLRTEARIDIGRVAADQPANIVVETVPAGQMTRIAPTAACFVVPNASGWDDFRRNRRSYRTDWALITQRTQVAIFLPENVPPQEFRDCLHEEIGQALGPLNDLFRLRDSVFNDDNFNLILQPFDMLILRTYYSPQLRNGMTRKQVAARLPSLLAGLNPVGQSVPSDARPPTSREWSELIGEALGRNTPPKRRIRAATKAIEVADRENYADHRIGFSFLARARVSTQIDPEQAAQDFATAYSIFQTLFGADDIHTAQGSLQMASLALSAGAADDALLFINASLPAARRGQDAIMLFSLLAIKAEIFDLKGNTGEADKIRSEALAWGKYGLLSDRILSRRLKQIAQLPPKPQAPES